MEQKLFGLSAIKRTTKMHPALGCGYGVNNVQRELGQPLPELPRDLQTLHNVYLRKRLLGEVDTERERRFRMLRGDWIACRVTHKPHIYKVDGKFTMAGFNFTLRRMTKEHSETTLSFINKLRMEQA